MKMKAKGLVTTILAVLLIWLIVASAENSPPVVPDNTIYGHVFDALTKKPLASALLSCSTCPPNETDDKGYYELGRFFAALTTYTIDCHKNGYRTFSRTVTTDLQGKAEVDFYLQPETKPIPGSPFDQPPDY